VYECWFVLLCSDHEFIEEQERYLYATCIRTMALPVGRYVNMININIAKFSIIIQIIIMLCILLHDLNCYAFSAQQIRFSVDLNGLPIIVFINPCSSITDLFCCCYCVTL